jgi:hypothetical protein
MIRITDIKIDLASLIIGFQKKGITSNVLFIFVNNKFLLLVA